MMSMTFQEEFGSLPTTLLRTYRRTNVSPADHDQILAAFGWTWDSPDIDWTKVMAYVESATVDGYYRPSRWL